MLGDLAVVVAVSAGAPAMICLVLAALQLLQLLQLLEGVVESCLVMCQSLLLYVLLLALLLAGAVEVEVEEPQLNTSGGLQQQCQRHHEAALAVAQLGSDSVATPRKQLVLPLKASLQHLQHPQQLARQTRWFVLGLLQPRIPAQGQRGTLWTVLVVGRRVGRTLGGACWATGRGWDRFPL